MRYNRLLLIFAVVAGLSACATDDEVILEGERATVFAESKQAKSGGDAIRLPVATTPSQWTQKEYQTNHLLPAVTFNAFLEADVDKLESGLLMNSAPLVVDNVLFGQTQKGGIFAYDHQIEEMVWAYEEQVTEEEQYVSGGIAYDDGKLLATFGTGDIIAFDAKEGNVLWQAKANAPIFGAPTISNGKAYVQTKKNTILSFQMKDGKLLISAQGIENTRPLLKGNSVAVENRNIIAGLTTGELVSFSSTGDRLWVQKVFAPSSKRTAGLVKDIIARPVIEGKTVFASSMGGATGAYYIHNGKKKWEALYGGPETPLVSPTTVFVLTEEGKLVALNKNNGALIWEKDLNTKEEQFKFPIFVNDKIAVFGTEETVVLIDPQTGKIVGKDDFGFVAAARPSYAKGHFFFTSEKGGMYKVSPAE
ncbi:MAG: PQQ-binding-like beta-propeller repeat protein [Alphaproteobacteria bacterium]|nr:PQQ-binding-like beta-propeller repeat protein [Alphaproteobacteria bacterium]MBN2779969.1 PQQ-binding-like beta-propeller repeat protein [Alphaproteobacteria bacterium]